MSYNETLIRIEKIANGYTVECYEAKPKKPTKAGSDCCVVPYESPYVEYAFTDQKGKSAIDAVKEFVGAKLPTLVRQMADAEDYDRAWEDATSKKK